jgi:hypothetical protein
MAYQNYEYDPYGSSWAKNYMKKAKAPGLYDPTKQQTGFDPNAPNAWSETAGGARNAIGEILKYGGYSPEMVQTISAPVISGINTEAGQARTRLEGDIRGRGLGYSSAGGRLQGELEGQRQQAISSALGGIVQQGAQMVPGAISEARQGEQMVQQLTLQSKQYDAQLAQAHEQLMADLSMSRAQSQQLVDQLKATMWSDENTRRVQLEKMSRDYNLSQQQLDQAMKIARMEQEQAELDRKTQFWATIAGGALGAAGTIAGAGIGNIVKPAVAAIT